MINRRQILASLLPASLGAGQNRGRSADTPNVVICMADDQGWGDTAYNGHPHLRTPHLDALAGAGIRFDRFYSGAPVCSPTRGSVLTGRHPFRYGIENANVGHLPREENTIAEALQARGYATGHFGKWHVGTLTNDAADGRRGGREKEHYSPPWEHGFEACFSTEVSVPTWNPNLKQPFPSRFWTGPGRDETKNLEGDGSRVIMDRAVPFIRNAVRQGRPFFAVIWFFSPHAPVLAGPAYRIMYEHLSDSEQHYFGCLTAMDEQIGRLRRELRELNIAADTMLWYSSDNGPVGKRRPSDPERGSTGGLRGRKHSLFEGGIRVPGLLEWPGRARAGTRTSIPCSSLDLLPTILEAAGHRLPSSRELDGLSLLPLIEGKWRGRPAPIAFETVDRGDAGRELRRGSPNLALISQRYKLLTYLDPQRDDADLLFNVQNDPKETTNLMDTMPQIGAGMKNTLALWRDSCRRSRQGADYSG